MIGSLREARQREWFASGRFAAWPSRNSPVSAGTWLHELAGLVKTSVSPPPFPEIAERGRGEPVIVVPGFCSPDVSTANLRKFLLYQGFAPRSWAGGFNIGPTRNAFESLVREICECADNGGAKVSLVGVSLGGTMAREAAKLCSGSVARVITVVSPINIPVITPLAPLARLTSVFWDENARNGFERIGEAPPVALTAIVSPCDGVVDWRCCIPRPTPTVELVEIAGAHMTMASNPEALRVIAARLSSATKSALQGIPLSE